MYTEILSDWFKDENYFKQRDNHLKAHPTYEYDLAQCPPLSGEELQHYKITYRGTYNQTIGKLLNIQQ